MVAEVKQKETSINLSKRIEIAAPIAVAFEALLEQLGPESVTHHGDPLPMKLEAFPGGRWYRDLGDNTGHFWGTVQVINPPALLEIMGPLFMSYPVMSHLQYRLTEQAGGTVLELTHRAIGELEADHCEGVVVGWEHKLQRVKEFAEKKG